LIDIQPAIQVSQSATEAMAARYRSSYPLAKLFKGAV